MCCSAQRRWQRCDKQQAAVFYFPFSICYFLLFLLLLLPQIHAKIIFWHLSGGWATGRGNEGLGTGWKGGRCMCTARKKGKKTIARQKINEPRRLNCPSALRGPGVRSTDCPTRNSSVLSNSITGCLGLKGTVDVKETFIQNVFICLNTPCICHSVTIVK